MSYHVLVSYIRDMDRNQPTEGESLMIHLADAWLTVEKLLNGRLSAIAGISVAEYRLLRAISLSPQGRASRVALAGEVGLTPSAVTRALTPLETRGIVATTRSERDARQALAGITDSGIELLTTATSVVQETMADIVEGLSFSTTDLGELTAFLDGVTSAAGRPPRGRVSER